MTSDSRTGVVVLAAGSGQRLGFGIPKAQVLLGEEPILRHALAGVVAASVADRIVVALPHGEKPGPGTLHEVVEVFLAEHRDAEWELSVVEGGATRADSVARALSALDGVERVLVHDAARPLVPVQVFQRVADALVAGARAVIPAIPVVDTIKQVHTSHGADADISPELVTGNIARESLRAVQTPQGFSYAALKAAHDDAQYLDDKQAEAITDDAMLLESRGVPVHVVAGSTYSLKITTPVDLILAEGLLEGPLAGRWMGEA
ncbi:MULTISPECIES: 2-C-methyl-D-erythritol 4-phosphate cytidylyltransferase [Arthrobacter]|uniref:2-C-methyl-D-erythritol 4-phosphate cytidylyltransferase n=2 Tax=Arthrobacter TaxID=1663 RepID=A0ABU9KL71_9MICC|nr:2-C-methyl-D-erythritol 4-phosphate cytidylyltransferase [Arthrobacter sp. YJM1]MDP5226691.1 2-C-methyl-D-erythritol 4-phosphate cytidylyltransferase [Arthrobacter sp. YJM1]